MTLSTRLTDALEIEHPIISAPMAIAAGGRLAAVVSSAGGLGLIGGGYGDGAWIQDQFDAAEGARVGIGFITWSLAKSPHLLAEALDRGPAAVMLSFGDPRPFAEEIHAAGVPLICQCQTLEHVGDAVAAGAQVVVAQGTEAGGHGSLRGTLSLVPEVADLLAARAPETLVVAAGGIADGRGLAAALALGADGVLMGTRFWASSEAIAQAGHHAALLRTNGDGTLRTRVADIARGLTWPAEFTGRIRRNAFTDKWDGRDDELARVADVEGPRYVEAWSRGDAENAGVFFGEAAGLIHQIEPAGAIIQRVVADAGSILTTQSAAVDRRG